MKCDGCPYGPRECDRFLARDENGNTYRYCQDNDELRRRRIENGDLIVSDNPYSLYSPDDVAEIRDFILYGNGEMEGSYKDKMKYKEIKLGVRTDKLAFAGM